MEKILIVKVITATLLSIAIFISVFTGKGFWGMHISMSGMLLLLALDTI